MSNEITIFNHEEFGDVRTVLIDNEPWFIGKDVATALGYENNRKALKDHVDEEDKGVTKCYTLGGSQTFVIINESGLYSLIIASKLPSAKKFKRWVTSEVLPSIRKYGYYVHEPKPMSPEEIALEERKLDVETLKENNKAAELLYKMTDVDTLSSQYKNILVSFAANRIAGRELLPLPTSEKIVYSATEIGEILGITANKVGRIANAHGMKTDVFGEWRRTVATNGKELDTWVYYDTALPHFKEIIELE